MAIPSILVETASGNALSVPGSWTDVSDDLIGTITIQRGRSKMLDDAQAGTGSLELNNSTRRWDPSNTSSPFNPIKIWRKFRITATLSAVTYPLMYAYARSYRVNWSAQVGPTISTTSVPLTDGIAILAQQQFAGSFAQQEYGPRIAAILNNSEVGWPSAWREGMSATGYDVKAMNYTHKAAWDAIRESVLAAGVDPGRICINGSGNLAVNPGAASGVTFGWAAPDLKYTAAALELSDDLVYNIVSVTPEGGSEQFAPVDTASIAAYGRKKYARSTINVNILDAALLARDIIAVTKEPKNRPDGFTVRPGKDSALWAAVLDIDLGDTFTMKATPPGGGSVYSKTMKVLGLQHTIPVNNLGDWTTQYHLVEQ